MNSFSKMVQNKRSKMLILTILLTIAIFVRESTGINLTYIVKKEGEKLQPNCVAEEDERYSAIGWVYPLSTNGEKEPQITTKFVPTMQSSYNCKFGKTDKCNKIWGLKNWQIDENSTRTLDLLFDNRWEDFPVLFTGNGAKEFEDRIEIPSIFKAGFSLRASEGVELLLCEGWNPYNYPCYHFNMTKNNIFLRKYMSFPKNSSNRDPFLDSYTAVANILSEDEWRNFVLALDDKGVLSLEDVSVNRTVIHYEDKNQLKPLYLLVRSAKSALWKIHQNHFMYTKNAQTTRLGPTFNLPSKDMCVSLYVSTCEVCLMRFFIVKNNEKKYLTEVAPSKNSEWKLVKLKDDHVEADKVNIFVETTFSENVNQSEGLWAIDDVRVCHENEVKISFLKLQDAENNKNIADEIACQVVQHPKWRPKKLVYSKIQDFPIIDNSSSPTSISLNWTQEDPQNQINYFITYQANDLCPPEFPNLDRVKSNGIVITKHNEVTIKSLIPYTTYNITFSSMLHENDKQISVTTQESEDITTGEIPANLKIQVTDTQAYASWDKINCKSVNGPITYAVTVVPVKTNSSQERRVQTENEIEIKDLQPFTEYTLHIATARNPENIRNKKHVFEMSSNFKTEPGSAPPIEQLELYSVDRNSVSFRYDLPKDSKGVPVYVQVSRCSAISFKKCKTSSYPIKPCKLWKKKYCIDINNLIPEQNYTFKVSLRNEGTQFYGDEVKVDAFMDERVPGPPSNITYKMVDCKSDQDYCHLNISWVHPYFQNGSITSFHIVLNDTEGDSTTNIQEILKIFNSSYYLPKYEYQVQFIPYGAHYELYIQSVNSKYKSEFTHIHVKTDDIGDHINQNPVLLETRATSVIFKLPPLDPRLKSYTLTTVVQDFNQDVSISNEIKRKPKVSDHLCHNFGETWVLPAMEVNSIEDKTIDIGSKDDLNKYLKPNTQYCFTFIVTNKYRKTEHDVVYFKKLKTAEKSPVITEKGYNHLYGLFLLLLLIPIGFLAYRCYKKKRARQSKQQENKENVYESLPFEEREEENCVSNDTYDRLLHK